MIRDGICDELTNTEKCLWDGGDCCLDRSRRDTSLCQTCTCKLTVDEDKLAASLQSTDVRMFRDPNDFQNLVLKTETVVAEVLSDEVCFTLCLDSEVKDVVNGWKYFAETGTCTCSWLKSTKCVEDIDLVEIDFENYVAFSLVSVKAFVQLTKIVDCGRNSAIFKKLSQLILQTF